MESYNASIPTAKLTFLGGGPSTLIFLLYASKTSRLYELISKKGIQIIEKGQNFGSGNFEKYSTTPPPPPTFIFLSYPSPLPLSPQQILIFSCELLRTGFRIHPFDSQRTRVSPFSIFLISFNELQFNFSGI